MSIPTNLLSLSQNLVGLCKSLFNHKSDASGHNLATTQKAGFLSPLDKQKLESLEEDFVSVTGTAYKTLGLTLVRINETSRTATLTATNSQIKSLFNGLSVVIKAPFDSVENPTLNINGLGAKPIRAIDDGGNGFSPLWWQGVTLLLVYDTFDVATGCWRLVTQPSNRDLEQIDLGKVSESLSGDSPTHLDLGVL